jgi:hypothetical protein
MKPVMTVTAIQANPNVNSFEGSVRMPNLTQNKLRKESGGTHYTTVSNLRQAAVAVAKKYNATLNFVEPKRFAAKKTTRH